MKRYRNTTVLVIITHLVLTLLVQVYFQYRLEYQLANYHKDLKELEDSSMLQAETITKVSNVLNIQHEINGSLADSLEKLIYVTEGLALGGKEE